ncbi:MAG: hypothetical protein WC654_02630 [Patescibacteria group bacterium]
MKKGLMILISVLVLALAIVISSDPWESRDRKDIRDPSASDSQSSSFGRDDTLKATCSASGGAWNSCGSACRTTPDAPCIEVCVEYCECSTDSQCPAGLLCSDFVDNVGVCL